MLLVGIIKSTDWRWNFITKSEIINQIWNNNIENYRKKDIEYIINSFIEIIRNEIKKGSKVKIDSLGTFSSFVRQAHIGKNLSTGDVGVIPSARCISFKPSKKLKE